MDMLEFEIFQIGIYCDTAYMILKNHNDLSIVKLIFFTYAINKKRYINKEIYDAKNTVDIISKEISTISGDFEGYADAVSLIIKAIYILDKAGEISIDNCVAHIKNLNYDYVRCNLESKFFSSVIEKSKNWSDIRFMKEVLHNV